MRRFSPLGDELSHAYDEYDDHNNNGVVGVGVGGRRDDDVRRREEGEKDVNHPGGSESDWSRIGILTTTRMMTTTTTAGAGGREVDNAHLSYCRLID